MDLYSGLVNKQSVLRVALVSRRPPRGAPVSLRAKNEKNTGVEIEMRRGMRYAYAVLLRYTVSIFNLFHVWGRLSEQSPLLGGGP